MTATTEEFAALTRVLDERWTCRQFHPQPVARETIQALLRLAQRTPSWCNTQPWRTVVTEGAGTDRFRKELLEHVVTATPTPDFDFPAQYTGVYRDRRRECGMQLYQSVGIAKGDHEKTMRQAVRNFELFDAPHVAIVTSEADLGVYGAVDCGLYIGSFLLGAQSLGLGAAPQAALASYAPFIREYFGIPDHRKVVAGISFGYPDTDHPVNGFRTARAEPDEVITWFAD
ncbi:nitroreductase [Nocardia amamiensis]|uniref:Nitroreductase n=1 Tax=Nocardia amamiensis TaxID=404578 RepID=A0ABS0CXR7_9NOCA|nr:nitroreductase [Nocardia amamiensis]MBF6299593.1 nitroreductase [Nocardia amamiensis]